MPRLSAGLLMYRIRDGIQVLLAHPGGPLFVNKDEEAWSIPKGEPDADEDLLVAAQREFEEETGVNPSGPFLPLKPIKQRGGKIVHAWAFEGEFDPATLVSNTFELEWPRGSGRRIEVPEIDRAAWFGLDEAAEKIVAAQRRFLFDLEAIVAAARC
jgi:predicted NUDIX family NTP pyrophosphohydrolase